jgi:hypothetical protein
MQNSDRGKKVTQGIVIHTSEIPIKRHKVNKHPMGENSPNLVTLLFPSTLMILKESTMYVDIGGNE